MRLKPSILALSFLALPSLASAESYLLLADNLHPAGLHTKVTTSTKMEMTVNMGEGMVMENTMTGTNVEDIKVSDADTLTIKTLEDGFDIDINMPGLGPQKQQQPGPLSDSTLTGNFKDGKWSLKSTAGNPAPASVEARQQTLNLKSQGQKALFGEEKRSVGDTWDIDTSKLGNFGEMEALNGKGKATFVAIEEKGGVQCAKITCKFDGTTTKNAEQLGKTTVSGNMTIWRDLKHLINRQEEIKVTMTSEMLPKPMKMDITTTTEVIAAP